ncbi:MAG: hypothetical protein PF693_00185 [Spirochaetia bacterium]|nr:hypothetical protein [Spirochaetia bacterium]
MFTQEISIRKEKIKSLLIIISSVIIAYIVYFILHLPFTISTLIIAITIPAIILPFPIILGYKYKKNMINAKRALEKSMEEKNVLLQEVHHRVKNNLSIILSLLHLRQSPASGNENDKLWFDNYERRIQTISLAHDHILNSSDFSTMHLGEFLLDQNSLIIPLMTDPYKPRLFSII